MYLRGQVQNFKGPTGKGALTSYLELKPIIDTNRLSIDELDYTLDNGDDSKI